MAWNDVVSLKKLSVQLETGDDRTTIYGNGRNQIGVVVYLEALDKDRNPVSLTSDEIIPHTQLVDAVTGEKLNWKENKGWNYTDIENEYHTLSTGGRAKRDAGGTTAKYYVQCHPDERRRTIPIAVKANLSNGTTYSTAEHGTPGFNSKVHLTALEEKRYTMDDMKLEREDTANGNKDIILYKSRIVYGDVYFDPSGCYAEKMSWDQDNYYFSIDKNEHPNFYIKQADINGYIRNEGDQQVSKNAFYNRFPEDSQELFYVGYIWEMSDEQQSKQVKLYLSEYPCRKQDIDIDININQRKNALCLTRIMYKANGYIWRSGGIEEKNLDMSFLSPGTQIFIYDQYGNKGEFHARPDDNDGWGNNIKVLNGPHNG